MHMNNNPFRLKEDNPSQRNCENQLSHASLSQQCYESLIQGKMQIQQNLNEYPKNIGKAKF